MPFRRGDDWKPPAPPPIAKTAESILEGLEGKGGPKFAAPEVVVTAASLPTPSLALSSIVERVLEPNAAALMVERLAGFPEAFDLALVNPGHTGDLANHEVLSHPAFVRAAARKGVVFYFGADQKVHRFSVGQEERRDLLKLPPGAPRADGLEPEFYLKPEWLPDLAAFVEADQTVILIGPSGCGKSEGVEQVFKARQQPLYVVNCNPAMTADDMEGRTDIVGGDTKFTLAAPALATRDGLGLFLDEADACPAETLYSLYRVLNHQGMHVLRLGAEGTIPRHPHFRVVAAQNTYGMGDERGLHHGRAYQDAAFLDRMTQRIAVDYPKPEDEVLILRKRTGLTAAASESIVKVAEALRKALKNDEDGIMFVCSIRRTLAVAANLRAGMSPERAWQFGALNGTPEEDAAKIREVLQRIYGTRLKMKAGAPT